jgi:hypothetical protein
MQSVLSHSMTRVTAPGLLNHSNISGYNTNVNPNTVGGVRKDVAAALQRNRESSMAMLNNQFDLLSQEDDVGRLAVPHPLNVSGTPFNFNNTQGNVSALLNNSASFLGIGQLAEERPNFNNT